jgi:hypothetical protein
VDERVGFNGVKERGGSRRSAAPAVPPLPMSLVGIFDSSSPVGLQSPAAITIMMHRDFRNFRNLEMAIVIDLL